MQILFKKWLEDAGHTDWQYSNASEPAFDSKIPSKYMMRDFKPTNNITKKHSPGKLFGRKSMKKK